MFVFFSFGRRVPFVNTHMVDVSISTQESVMCNKKIKMYIKEIKRSFKKKLKHER